MLHQKKLKRLCIMMLLIYMGEAMSQYLPYNDIKFDSDVKLEDILNTSDDS